MFAFAVSANATEKYSRDLNEEFHAAVGDGFDEDQMFMASGGVTSSQEPYVVQVANAGLATETAILFGYNKYFAAANYGSGANITVSMGLTNVTYPELLAQSSFQPFEVVLTRVESSSSSQLTTSMLLKRQDASGNDQARPITVSSYYSPDQFANNIIDVKQNYRIDSQTWIEYQVLAGASAKFSFFVAAKVDVASTLNNQAPIKEYTAQRVRTFK